MQDTRVMTADAPDGSSGARQCGPAKNVKGALDPFMHRHPSPETLSSKAAQIGYEWTDAAAMLREGADVLDHVHIADTINHTASSGVRNIVGEVDGSSRRHAHVTLVTSIDDIDPSAATAERQAGCAPRSSQ
jgi:hypothetical protein